MFDKSELTDELEALKGDLSRLLNTTGEEIFDTTRNLPEAVADQIKSALNELGETLSAQQENLESIISERPIASLASAFALGAVVGFMLRRLKLNTENVIKHLRALWRTDRIIADIRMRHMLIGLGLRAFAALIAAFGLLMLELSAYFALVQIWSAVSAAAILGAVNFAIAAILCLIAARPPSGRELELATEIHGSAVDALGLEARALQSQMSGAIHNPLNRILPLLIVPLITIIINSLNKSAAKPAKAAPREAAEHK